MPTAIVPVGRPDVMSMVDSLPFSQSCENNRQPILEQLRALFLEPGTVLEIGTGTGQHAEYMASRLPHLHWLPTDHPDNVWMCQQRLERADLANVDSPRSLDVGGWPWTLPCFEYAFSANTAHIMSWEEVVGMFSGIAEGLGSGGRFCLYGPFNYQGKYTSDSNQQFDQYLRSRAEHMGIRDMDDLTDMASGLGLSLLKDAGMPANNRLLVFGREN